MFPVVVSLLATGAFATVGPLTGNITCAHVPIANLTSLLGCATNARRKFSCLGDSHAFPTVTTKRHGSVGQTHPRYAIRFDDRFRSCIAVHVQVAQLGLPRPALHLFAHADLGGGPMSVAYNRLQEELASYNFCVAEYLSCAVDQECRRVVIATLDRGFSRAHVGLQLGLQRPNIVSRAA